MKLYRSANGLFFVKLFTVVVLEYFQGTRFRALSHNATLFRSLAGQLLSPSRGGFQLRVRCVLRSNGRVVAELLTIEVKSLLSRSEERRVGKECCCRLLADLFEITI